MDTTLPADRLPELAEGIRVAMVTSAAPHGLDARPLTVQRVEDDRVWFLVARDAEWVPPTAGHQVNVALTGSDRWISLSGVATLVTDPGVLDELGDPVSDAWFGDGHEPAALRVDVGHGEWWRSAGGPRILLELVRAKVTGSMPDAGERGTVEV